MIDIEKIFTVKNIIIYIIIMNLIGFLCMWVDKKKAQKGRWRIKEATLLTISLIGGSIGSLIGMYIFHHKTQKPRFYIGIPIMIIIQIILIIMLIIK